MGEITKCRECGYPLEWNADAINTSGAADGRLKLHDIKPVLVLGCQHCSHTEATIDADSAKARAMLNHRQPHGEVRVVKVGAAMIAVERDRQITDENYSDTHDDEHADESIARAAACYAMPERFRKSRKDGLWAWSRECWKPTPNDRVRELVKAGALIAAEIDRIERTVEKGVDFSFDTGARVRPREPSPGVTVAREVLEKVREELQMIERGNWSSPASASEAARNALALLKDSPHA